MPAGYSRTDSYKHHKGRSRPITDADRAASYMYCIWLLQRPRGKDGLHCANANYDAWTSGHLSAKGFDLYSRQNGKWKWAGCAESVRIPLLRILKKYF